MMISPSDDLIIMLLFISGCLAILIIGGVVLEIGEWILDKVRSR